MATGAAHRTERLLCLVFIVKAHGRRGVTRARLRTLVPDYEQCASDEAFERMFERDKRDLRDAGIELEVIQRDPWHEDEHAYVLPERSLLSLPEFTAAELQALAQAAEAWDRGAWDALASGALRKLEVFGEDILPEPMLRVVLRADGHLAPLRQAVRQRRAVSFAYRKPGQAVPETRTVEPWGIAHRVGAWYCVAFDRGRGAPRVFRTSRIVGDVQDIDPATQAVDPDWLSVIDIERQNAASTLVRLLAQPGHGWRFRHQATVVGSRDIDGVAYDELSLELHERQGDVAALAASAPHVLVLSPPDLRARVIEQLQGAARG